MTEQKKDEIPPATLYQFREVTKLIESPQTPPQKLRIVTESLVRIISTEQPYMTGVYRLVHAGDSMAFWRGSDDTVYSGMIIKKIDDFWGLVAYHVEYVLECPPFEEYGK